MSKNKFIDCVTFFDNNFMFNLRYNILKNYIDYFVICESRYDHKNNIKKCIDKETKFKLIKKDFRSVNYKELGKYNLYLFDGPHHEKDQYDALTFVHTALEKKFILIVDDWNWDQVRLGTNKAIQDLNFKIIAGLEIMTTQNSSSAYVQGQNSEWHNGYCFFVIEK